MMDSEEMEIVIKKIVELESMPREEILSLTNDDFLHYIKILKAKKMLEEISLE